MSIYNPPSKTQGVFNPSNFGGLGSGGQITTDYLDANYIQFPVSQGNTTLVGTSVLGDITQQGDFSTTGDLVVNDVNIITAIGTKQDTIEDGDLTIAKTSGLQSALNDKQDTIGDGDLTIANTNGLQSALNDKQDTIEDGDLTIANTNGLQSALNDKQDTIEDGDLTIANTNGLQSALNDKQDTIEDGDLTIAKTDGLQPALNDKQDTIEDGDLTIAKTDGLQTALNGKQDTISNFEVNGNVNLNTSGTNFDTIVVRRPSNTTGLTDDYLIDFNELQIWVNNANILVENASSLVSSVVSWSNKDIELGSQLSPTNLYSGLIENGDGVLTLDPSPTDIAIIIKNIPTSKINDIHAVQIYNIVSTTLGNRAIGLAIELYNSKNDPDLNTILAQTNEISVRDSVYRFDFPSINTYTLGYNIQGILPDSGAYVNLVTLEVVTPFSFPFNITGNMDVSGSITLPTIGDVETTIQGKQDTIEDGDLTIANTNGLQSALNDKQDTIEDGDLTIANTNGLQPALNNKQDTIEDGDLTIAKTDGLQTALDNKYDDTGGTIDGDVDISGDLVVGTTNVITEIGTKQDEITTSTDLSCNTLSAVGNIDVGGYLLAPNQPSFRAYPSADDTTNGDASLPFDTIDFDNMSGYDTTDYEYTVPVAGIWLFTWSCGVVEDTNYLSSIKKNNIIYDRSVIDADQCLRTYDTISAKGLSIMMCAVGDTIKITVNGELQAASTASASHLAGDSQFNSFAGVLLG